MGLWPTDTLEITLDLIYDLICYLYRENKPGLLWCLDFEKAFDSVDWKFMFKVLRAFGFGPDICQWISTFYKYTKSSVTVNGQLSQWFAIQRGCRQWDPISPYFVYFMCRDTCHYDQTK